MKSKFIYTKVAATLMCTTLLFACSNDPSTVTESEAKTQNVTTDSIGAENISALINDKAKYDKDDFYSDWKKENPIYIELNGNDVSFDKQAPVIFQNGTVTIRTGGTYVLSGKLDDGQIVVNAEDKSTVRLVLNGVNISSTDSSAIHVIQSEKTIISLEEGTENVLSDGKQYNTDEDEPNAALFSKDDLTINGTGKLVVTGNYNNGIASKDDLKITGGVININAVDDGLLGRDLIAVKEGTITIDAGGDGIKSTNDKDTAKGNIAIEGGSFAISAGNDGIQAEKALLIADGSFDLQTGGGSPETINNKDNMRGPWEKTTTTTNANELESESTKGLKAKTQLAIAGGTFTIDSLDDAVHSNDNVTIAGGYLTITTGDDGIHADTTVETSGGKINIIKSYEGLEGNVITVNDGEIHIISTDDGINVAGGNDGSGFGRPPQFGPNSQQPMFGENAEAATKDKPESKTNENSTGSNSETETTTKTENKLTINGGYIYVDAAGDGLDSNGSIYMTDGTVIVNGPTENMNGSLDYDQTFEMSGGFLIAAGSSGMAQATSEQSPQNSLLMTYPETQAAGTIVHLQDSDGNSIVTFAPKKDYQAVFISSPKLAKDETYTLFSGGTSNGKEKDGLFSSGTYKEGKKVVEFKITDSVTWLNESGVTTARRSGPGGFGRPEGMGMDPNGDPNRQGRGPGGMFAELDEETRAKLEAIMEQERQGAITREEAQAKMAELGIEFPGKRPRQN